ncbi:MAG TPA: exodeoxyribonuclease I [Candidatus Saccharimonadales bacterium]|nr:exodeoxyribonuclease I [Candidatus Saccharimonadales bacterium]
MQPASFFFYDLETSGINSRDARIMQFAGVRTDLNLKPIGEPENILIKLTPDILPDPDAILITGITPQQTLADGITEAEFLQHFAENIATPGTVFLGFNTVRFDDEFMRCLHYRNFYDAYEWQWQDGKSRWDILDVVRMVRALRPEGIKWPFDVNGKPTNRLELLTGLNGLSHEHAHDALSDVYATIEVARLIRNKQPKMFDYLFSMRDKRKVADLVDAEQPFVYTSGQYSSEFEKTAVAVKLGDHPKKQGTALVFDLRNDPLQYKDVTPEQLAEAWKWKKDSTEPRLPVKQLAYNKCPAVAPLGVLDDASRERLQIDLQTIQKNFNALRAMPGFADNVRKAADILDAGFQTTLLADDRHVDSQLYDGFFGPQDKQSMRVVRAAQPAELGDLGLHFKDKRLEALLPLYKARNHPKQLNDEERQAWDEFCKKQLLGGGSKSRMGWFMGRLQDIANQGNLTGHQEYILEELKLYAESVMPEVD